MAKTKKTATSKGLYKNTISKKGVSEVIAVTLVIVVSVILAGLFFAWLRDSSKNKLDQTSDVLLSQASYLSCMEAKYKVDSCQIYRTSKTAKIMFTNNSDLKIFNLMLTIEGKNETGNNMKLIGRFEDIVSGGQTVNLSSDTNFTYTREDYNHITLDTTEITSIVLTNGTCPKKSKILTCTVVSDPFIGSIASFSEPSYPSGEPISFTSASSGGSESYTCVWNSNIDGNFGAECNTTFALSVGTHTITLYVNDGTNTTSDTATLTIASQGTIATPTASPAAGTYTSTQSVTLSSTTPDANIYYTLDGNTPTQSSTLYSTLISISETTTLKAKAFKTGWTDSNVLTAVYTINIPVACSLTPTNGQINYLEHLDFIDINATTLAASYTLQRDLNFLDDNSYCQPETYKTTWTTGTGWTPIGTEGAPFAGTFDGNNYTISNLYINRPATNYVGFFGDVQINNAISNLHLIDVNVTGQFHVGGLIGEMVFGSGTVYNCSSSGEVHGFSNVGGLIGVSYNGNPLIDLCYSTAAVSGDDHVGGFIGLLRVSRITNSYSTGAVSGSTNVGGFSGDATFANITNSYSTGEVTGTSYGISGFSNDGEYTDALNSYWDMNTSLQTTSAVGTGKTTTQMKTQSTFTDWNFTSIWAIDEGSSYPYLQANEQTPHPGYAVAGSQQYNTLALSPGTMVNNTTVGEEAWTIPDNAKVSDDNYSSAIIVYFTGGLYRNTNYLKATNFGFNIPTGATIDGIKVEIEKYSASAFDLNVRIIKADNSIGTTNKAKLTEQWPTSDANTYTIYGDTNDLWGETWTAEQINDANFGVVISGAPTIGGVCLNRDSLISTDNGYVKIKDLHVGDNVVSYNDTTRQLELKPVTSVWSRPISVANNRYFYIYYNNGKVIKATENHRFYTNGNYVRADELKVGDNLLSNGLLEYPIENIEIIENTTDQVWDIEVEDNHNFFANDILVHNHPGSNTYAYVDHIRMTVYYTSSTPPELPYVMNGAVKLYIHPTDNSTGVVWGCDGTFIDGLSIRNGAANTTAIMAGCATRPIAASVCDGLTFGGYSDWYLPVKDQLSAIWNACTGTKTNACMNAAINKGGYAGSWANIASNNYYWSSMQYNPAAVYMIYMSSGNIEYYSKNSGSTYVRCVRGDEQVETFVETPVADPVAGVYSSLQLITLSGATSGASIYFTTDGNTPTTGSALYSSPIIINVGTVITLKAKAFKTGWSDSNVFTGTYAIGGGPLQ